eukprot:gene1595-biopygen2543
MLSAVVCIVMAAVPSMAAALPHRAAVFYGPDGSTELRLRFDLGLPPGARPSVDAVDGGVMLRGPLGGVSVLGLGNASVSVAPDPVGTGLGGDPYAVRHPPVLLGSSPTGCPARPSHHRRHRHLPSSRLYGGPADGHAVNANHDLASAAATHGDLNHSDTVPCRWTEVPGKVSPDALAAPRLFVGRTAGCIRSCRASYRMALAISVLSADLGQCTAYPAQRRHKRETRAGLDGACPCGPGHPRGAMPASPPPSRTQNSRRPAAPLRFACPPPLALR